MMPTGPKNDTKMMPKLSDLPNKLAAASELFQQGAGGRGEAFRIRRGLSGTASLRRHVERHVSSEVTFKKLVKFPKK